MKEKNLHMTPIVYGLMLLMTTCFLLFMSSDVQASTIITTDVTQPSDGCVLLGIHGKYIADIDNALKRINAIRKEACDTGVKNPSTGKALTSSDYVPIKWSSDLEYIARIRAAESSITMAHERTNGNSCFSISSPNGISSWGEVLAWNWSNSMLNGIEQWYAEKSDWVNNTGAVTGHYTQMIDPENTYVGLGTFCSNDVEYYNTTAGEFSSSTSSLDQTQGKSISDCFQILEVSSSYLSGSPIIEGSSSLDAGASANLIAKIGISSSSTKLCIMNPVWKSSNTAILSVTSSNDFYGKVTANKCGSATISATVCGKTVSKTITVNHQFGKAKVKTASTVFKTGKSVQTCTKCGQTKTTTIKKLTPTIKLSAKNKRINRKKTYILKISKLANGDSVKSVKSSSKSIVTVKKIKKNQYKISAKNKKGKAVIKVMLKSGKTAKCKVVVK